MPAYAEPGSAPSATGLATLLAEAICASARVDRPMIIVARGSEHSSRSVHRLIVELARLSPGTPLCGFFFFNAGKAPSWHILATLDRL